MRDTSLERVGLIPAGGVAKRITPLPCSKELYPIGFHSGGGSLGARSKVVSHYLLERMRLAGVTKAYIVLRRGKWDIPAYFGDGSGLGLDLAYLIMGSPAGPPYTSDQAYPFLKQALVAFGFPDIIFQPDDAYAQMFGRQAITDADVVLGLVPAPEPHKADLVELDGAGRVRSVIPKPHDRRHPYTWIAAVWTPAFTRFMHEHLQISGENTRPAGEGDAVERELSMGHVFLAALLRGLRFEAVLFPEGGYLDIGSPEDLVKAVRSFA